jgi:Ser/Thr protein kinase RdoA (MazF antagonist)
VRSDTGAHSVVDADGEYWRTWMFIENTRSHETIDSPAMARAVGETIGRFHAALADLREPPIHETIPDFHNTPMRYASLLDAVRDDPAGRAGVARREIGDLKERSRWATELAEACEAGDIPRRVVHNDTKVSNVLFDARGGEALCLIDLDTVMPGLSVLDIADCVRTAAATAPEDTNDPAAMRTNMETLECIVQGYLAHARQVLGAAEEGLIPIACATIVFEQAVRFLEDFLRGDTYYRIRYPEHNLVRARAQIALLMDLEVNLGLS